MHLRLLCGWALALLGLCACGDLSVRSVGVTEVVPAQLEGEWRGSWTSTRDNSTGQLLIRVQEFDLQPVVSLNIDNPCLVPGAYQLSIAGETISLQTNGVTVFQAELGTDGLLSGNYGCLADGGFWSAEFVRELPKVEDLSGRWVGTVGVPGVFEEELALTLTMSVEAGSLRLDGFAESPSTLSTTVPLNGLVIFRDEDFDLILRTTNGFDPELLLSGVGARDPLRVEAGLLQVLNPPPGIPFSQALFQVERLPD